MNTMRLLGWVLLAAALGMPVPAAEASPLESEIAGRAEAFLPPVGARLAEHGGGEARRESVRVTPAGAAERHPPNTPPEGPRLHVTHCVWRE